MLIVELWGVGAESHVQGWLKSLLCALGIIRGWGTQDESKFSSFVCDVNQGNDKFGYKKVVLRISCEPPGMETFLQDLLQVVKKWDVVVCKIRSNRMS